MSGSGRVVYTDLDGTMLGAYGCFFLDAAGEPTLEPARALHQLQCSGVPLVLVSGRTRVQLLEAARVLGADGFVAELGAVIGWDRGFSHSVVDGLVPAGHEGRLPTEVMADHRVVEDLLDRYPGRVEWHSPWHTGRETDAMIRGTLDLAEARRWLAAHGHTWLDIADNGVLPAPEPPPGLETTLDDDVWPPRVYHLKPAGVTKGTGIAADLERRGLVRDDAIAIGDSVSDLDMAPYVRELWIVANGASDPNVAARLDRLDNVRLTSSPLGAGWAQAVRAFLADG